MKKKNDNVFSTKNLKIIFFYDRLRFYSFLTIILSSSVEESKVQSTHLCTGVSEMLSRGRETCSALKISIDGALSTLIGKWRKKPHFIFYYYQVAFIHLSVRVSHIGDASEARDSMTSSCDQVRTCIIFYAFPSLQYP